MKTDILTAKKILFAAVRYILLLVFAIFFIFPYFYMLTRSLMSLSEVNSPDFILFPSKLHFENYKIVADYLPFLKNTLLIIVINGFFIPVTGAMIAFPFARYRFKGKNIMFSCLMATVMLPGSVTTIPLCTVQQTGAFRYSCIAVGRCIFWRKCITDFSYRSVHARHSQRTG